MFDRIRRWHKNLPESKKHLELISSLLSVPVLLTVLMLNLNNLSTSKQATPTPQPTPTPVVKYIFEQSPRPTTQTTPLPTQAACIKKVGPVNILSPQEGETTNKNPLTIDISHDDSYCSVVWSYRINGGDWSDYTSNEIDLYNLTSGNKTLNVRILSIASNDEVDLTRSFTYVNNTTAPTATPTPTSIPTPTITPNP